jgi:predicted peroxiredoxin
MEEKKKLVILISRGFDDERASVAWSIANGGIKTGLDVSIFLTSSGVDWVRKGAMEVAHINPFDPTMKEMIQFVINSGCTIMVCPPCLKVRNLSEGDLIEGVVITGSGAMHELIKQGAATLSF